MDISIRLARESISPPNTPDTVRFRELLAACAPNTPMLAHEFNRRCMDYPSPIIRQDNGLAAECYLYDGTGRLAAVAINFENGNCVVWSTAGHLAYRMDPRF